MHPVAGLFISVTFMSSLVAPAYHNSVKLRRDGVLNLYPFPRVGRASKQTWDMPVQDLHIDFKPEQKRQMVAFPRVGRNPFQPTLQDLRLFSQPLPDIQGLVQILCRGRNPCVATRTEGIDKTDGMWFGPRLGRSLKNGADDDEDTPTNQSENDRSEPEETETELFEERKKRQTL